MQQPIHDTDPFAQRRLRRRQDRYCVLPQSGAQGSIPIPETQNETSAPGSSASSTSEPTEIDSPPSHSNEVAVDKNSLARHEEKTESSREIQNTGETESARKMEVEQVTPANEAHD